MHKIIVSMLAKLCAEEPINWYRHLRKVQMIMNSTSSRSTQFSPIKLLTGVEMRLSDQPDLREILNEEACDSFFRDRDEVRAEARENILRIQNENIRTFNTKRRMEEEYDVNELVAIRRTQFGTGLKPRGNLLVLTKL